MVEPSTGVGLAALAAAYLGKDGVNKLLGPTAEYFGEGLRNLVEKRISNLNRIFERASQRLGQELEKAGEIPPRLVKEVIDSGTFSEDTTMIEYYGGVLASSRTPTGVDDRGVRIARTISNLSSYQVRAHYVLYSALAAVHRGQKLVPTKINDRNALQTYLPLGTFIDCMKLDDAEGERGREIISHALHGLKNEGLIDNWLAGRNAILTKRFKDMPVKDGLVFRPSLFGFEVFWWCLGFGQSNIDRFLSEETVFPMVDELTLLGAQRAIDFKQA